MLKRYAPKLRNIVKVLCDGGYTGEKFANAVTAMIDAEVEIAKRREQGRFAVIGKRWIYSRKVFQLAGSFSAAMEKLREETAYD